MSNGGGWGTRPNNRKIVPNTKDAKLPLPPKITPKPVYGAPISRPEMMSTRVPQRPNQAAVPAPVQHQQPMRAPQHVRPQQQQPIQEILLESMIIAGVKVNKVRRGGQIMYRLADAAAGSALTEAQKKILSNEIVQMHARETAASNAAAGKQTAPTPQSTEPTREELAKLASDMTYERRNYVIKKRMREELHSDHSKILRPKLRPAFESLEDAAERLLPYHIYNYRDADLAFDGKAIDEQLAINRQFFNSKFEQMNERMQCLLRLESQRKVPPELEIMCDVLLVDDEKKNLHILRTGYGKYLSAVSQASQSGYVSPMQMTMQVAQAAEQQHRQARIASSNHSSTSYLNMTLPTSTSVSSLVGYTESLDKAPSVTSSAQQSEADDEDDEEQDDNNNSDEEEEASEEGEEASESEEDDISI